MTTEGPPRGSRDNGLRCAGYAAIADLDPRIADRLLAELRDAGIAAYAAPTPGAVGGYMETRLPDRPIDRLWVDSASVDRARAMVGDEQAKEPPAAVEPVPAAGGPAGASGPDDGIDFDAAWAQMVASLRDPAAASEWPGDTDEEESEAGYDPAQEEHFTPPPPPPLPRLRSVTFAAITAIVIGLVILATDFDGGGFTFLAAVAIAAGVISLIWNMRNGPPNDSGWDDGAVV